MENPKQRNLPRSILMVTLNYPDSRQPLCVMETTLLSARIVADNGPVSIRVSGGLIQEDLAWGWACTKRPCQRTSANN